MVATATGPQIEYAATTFDAAKNQEITDNTAAAAANAAEIQKNTDKLVDIVAAINVGRFDGTGSLTLSPATGTWSCLRNSEGRYTVTSDQAPASILCQVQTSQTGQRWTAVVDNITPTTFDVDVRSGNGYDDPDAVTFIAI